MHFDVNLELAGLIYAVCICIIHRITHREKKFSNRVFHKTLVLNMFMTAMDISAGLLFNHYQNLNPFFIQVVDTVFYFLVIWMAYTLSRYGDSLADPDSDNPKSWFIAKAVFCMQTVMLLANLAWGKHLFFHVDSDGYHYSPLYFSSFIAPTTLTLLFAIRLLKSGREQIRRKRAPVICSAFVAITASALELLSGYNTMIFGLCTTAALTITLMNLETPEYTHLARSMRSYNNDLEKEVETRTKQITDAKNSLIYGIAQFLEENNSTPGHLKRTSSITAILCDELKKDTDDVRLFSLYENMKIAAPLQELGKLDLTADPVKETADIKEEEDRTVLAEKARAGAAIVRNILHDCNDYELTATAENMVLYKNENYDGTGYPEGLRRSQIPFEARIIALTDEIDRLVGCGPSQDEAAIDKAVSTIEGKMGTRFDPKLIGPLEAVRDKIKEFYRQEMPQANRVHI